MKITRRTKIISETERKYSYVVKKRPTFFFCPACDERREMLSINEAAKMIGENWREIVRRIEDGAIHTSETESGEIYVCAKSLDKFAQNI